MTHKSDHETLKYFARSVQKTLQELENAVGIEFGLAQDPINPNVLAFGLSYKGKFLPILLADLSEAKILPQIPDESRN